MERNCIVKDLTWVSFHMEPLFPLAHVLHFFLTLFHLISFVWNGLGKEKHMNGLLMAQQSACYG